MVIDNSSKGNRVSADRCAHLIAVSMVNGLDEVWVAKQPILFFVYASQYLPAFAKKYSHLMVRYLTKSGKKVCIRDDSSSLQ